MQEQLIQEVRRREWIIRIFSVQRLRAAPRRRLLAEINKEWQERRYLLIRFMLFRK